MLIPLKQFYCDTCRQIINSPSEGYTEWIVQDNYCKGFKIIHNKPYSPQIETGCSQYLGIKVVGAKSSIALDRMTLLGLSILLPFLNDGDFTRRKTRSRVKEVDLQSFIDFFSRLTIPYYEEARMYFAEAENNLFNRGICGEDVYDSSNLEKIVRTFHKD
jgi:hypothetical protein